MSKWKEMVVGNMGYTYGGLTNKTIADFGYGKPFIPYMNVFSSVKINPKFLLLVNINPSERQNQVKYGDLFFTTSSETVEEVGMTSVLLDDIGEAYLNSFCFGFRLNNFDDLLPEFAPFLFRGNVLRKKISLFGQGSTRYNLPKTEMLDKLKINLPSLPEQRKIAQILTTTDSVIEKTQAAIAKYKAIKQGMLHDLFARGIDITTGKLRPKQKDAPELYKESELGWIPKEWDVNRLEEVTDYVDYRGKTPPKSEFGIYLVTARNIKEGFIDYEISKEYIREDAYESAMSRGKVKLGDVLITTEAPMGNVAQIDKDDIALAQRVIKYRGFETKLNNDYLANYLMSEGFQRLLYSEATGSTVLGIKGSRLHKLKIIVPEIDEQICIAERIKNNTKILESEETYLQKLQQIKSGLMTDLLSGKKLVTVTEELETQTR
jgi:type I restriction enzyme S subunit